MLDTLQASDFTPFLHQTLTLSFEPDKPLAAELMAVKEQPGSYTPIDRVPFSITIRTDQKTHYYNQMMAVLDHPAKGQIPLFFVPVGFDGVGVLYEAVFG